MAAQQIVILSAVQQIVILSAVQKIVILSEVWRGFLRQTESKNLLLEMPMPCQGFSETLR
jgi:hypothetical protein